MLTLHSICLVYVTVNEENGRALFYWLTEATQDPASKPLVLWLNGGPGCSSIAYGMSEEVGPFHVDKDGKSVLLEPLFLEHRSCDLHCVAAEDLLQFVLNWLERFPQYKGRDFYMKGESYAGHYVPQLSQVGNSVTDEYHDHLGLFQFWWTVGLISDQTYKKLNDVCDKAFYYRPSQECVQIRENLLQEVDYEYNQEKPTQFTRIHDSSGDTDRVIPVTSTRYTINALNLTTISPWRAWYEDGQVGGWTQKYDGLTFVAVRGAGHKVPLHKPKLALTLLKSFIAGTPMPSFKQVIESKISSQ
ncbi:serine carboxypeptidase II-2, partial [Tanacetum coccineum]